MKKALWLLLLLPMAGYFLWKKDQLPEASQTTTQKKGKKTRSKALLARRETSVHTVKDASCSKMAVKLDNMDFQEPLEVTLRDLESSDFIGCKDNELTDQINAISQVCFKPRKKEEDHQCMALLVTLRSRLRARNIKEPSTREELADIILAEFSKIPPDFNYLKKVAGELLDKDPNDETVQQIWATAAVIGDGDPAKVPAEAIQEIEERIGRDRLENDPDFRGVDMVMKTKFEPQAMESYHREILSRDPKDVHAREMIGWAYYRQGKKEEALAELDAILKQNPGDQHIIQIREEILSPDANPDSYRARISIGIQLDDLF